MRHVKPGNAVRLKATVTDLDGVLFDPPAAIAVILALPDKSTTNLGAPVRDSQGVYHLDALVGNPMPEGIAVHRWVEAGSPVDSNALAEKKFYVDPLDF
jgi:hypothetical protein